MSGASHSERDQQHLGDRPGTAAAEVRPARIRRQPARRRAAQRGRWPLGAAGDRAMTTPMIAPPRSAVRPASWAVLLGVGQQPHGRTLQDGEASSGRQCARSRPAARTAAPGAGSRRQRGPGEHHHRDRDAADRTLISSRNAPHHAHDREQTQLGESPPPRIPLASQPAPIPPSGSADRADGRRMYPASPGCGRCLDAVAVAPA